MLIYKVIQILFDHRKIFHLISLFNQMKTTFENYFFIFNYLRKYFFFLFHKTERCTSHPPPLTRKNFSRGVNVSNCQLELKLFFGRQLELVVHLEKEKKNPQNNNNII